MRKPMPKCDFNKSVLENMQQIYIRTSMAKCDFNKAAKQLN